MEVNFRFVSSKLSIAAIASHIFEEILAGAKAMLEVSKADPFRAAETFANAIQTCIGAEETIMLSSYRTRNNRVI